MLWVIEMVGWLQTLCFFSCTKCAKCHGVFLKNDSPAFHSTMGASCPWSTVFFQRVLQRQHVQSKWKKIKSTSLLKSTSSLLLFNAHHKTNKHFVPETLKNGHFSKGEFLLVSPSFPGRLALESWHERLVADGEILTRDHSVTGETLGFLKSGKWRKDMSNVVDMDEYCGSIISWSLIPFALAGSWMILGSSGMLGSPGLASLVLCLLFVELDLDALMLSESVFPRCTSYTEMRLNIPFRYFHMYL